MPEMKNNFQRGRMNKDLDERIVPDGEYRDALNIEVSTSDDSNVGTLQTIKGNVFLPGQLQEGVCVGSIADEKINKLYFLVAGDDKDVIVEYDYTTESFEPVCVDNHSATGIRALNFNADFLITGINIIEDLLFWTDNNSEPKRINITRGKAGSSNWTTHTSLMVRDTSSSAPPNTLIDSGKLIEEEHLTVIRKGPPAPPVLEMVDTGRGDEDGDGDKGGEELRREISGIGLNGNLDTWIDPNTGELAAEIIIGVIHDTDGDTGYQAGTDFLAGDYLIVYAWDDPTVRVRLKVLSGGSIGYTCKIESGSIEITDYTRWMVTLERSDSLFQFKFVRFACRYKYEDGEYSAFSPFTQPAFLPGKFNYVPKEGYNLGMLNNVRNLVVKDFVHDRQISDNVIAIDILYKESNSPNVYSVKTIKKRDYDQNKWDEWNAISSKRGVDPSNVDFWNGTKGRVKGYMPITTEMIHAVLPANQLLRPWDNVPKAALAQEVIGNRLVYGNYLQNYNLENLDLTPGDSNIKVDIRLDLHSYNIGGTLPEEVHAGLRDHMNYNPAKSIKSLRTYQLGVVYLDEYGRETPVFSEDKRGSILNLNQLSTTESSVYVKKSLAPKRNSLLVKMENNPPDWATHMKFFVKETSNEYYNLCMDRWYEAEDGNIWLSFPSADRNKVDEETFIVLKKEHDNSNFVDEPARYKIIAIENEAPRYIKLQNISMGGITDYHNTTASPPHYQIGPNGNGFPGPANSNLHSFQINIHETAFVAAGWKESLINQDISQCFFRVVGSGVGSSKWYRLKQINFDGGDGTYVLKSGKQFGDDMDFTSADGSYFTRNKGLEVEVMKKIPEDRAEFDGRFFAKILKDDTLITRLGVISGSTSNLVTTSSMRVQYINPTATQSNWGGWDGYGSSPKKISIDNDTGAHWFEPGGYSGGHGGRFWKMAGDDEDVASTSASSGWFIDKVEAFRPLKGQVRKFVSNKDDNVKWTAGAECAWRNCDYASSWNNPIKRLLQATGLDTYNDGGGLSYLNMTMYGPGRSGDFMRAHHNVSRSLGIDTSIGLIHLSYAGLNETTGSSGSYSGLNDYKNDDWDFKQGGKHSLDMAFIKKLLKPGTIFTWKEDPGEVLYKTITGTPVNTNADYSMINMNREELDRDGGQGVFLYNYADFNDYFITYHHTAYQHDSWWCSYDLDFTDFASRGVSNHEESCAYWVAYYASITTWHVSLCNHDGTPGAQNTSAGAIYCGGYGGWGRHYNFPTGIHSWKTCYNRRRRFAIFAEVLDGGGALGSVAPHYYLPTNDPTLPAHFDAAATAITAFPTGHAQAGTTFESLGAAGKAPGIRPDGMYSGYNVHPGGSYDFDLGDGNGATSHDQIPQFKRWDANNATNGGVPRESGDPGTVTFQIKEHFEEDSEKFTSTNPAIWETEPKEDVGLDIYHEIGQIYPIYLNNKTIEQFVGPVHLEIERNTYVQCWDPPYAPGNGALTIILDIPQHQGTPIPGGVPTTDVRVLAAKENYVRLGIPQSSAMWLAQEIPLDRTDATHVTPPVGAYLMFHRADGGRTEAHVGPNTYDEPGEGTWFELVGISGEVGVHNKQIRLPWFNCYSFGNGVESDRIRDDYNQVTIDNGPKASTTIEEPYLEERRTNGFIWSGLYNSTSGVNDLNQFIAAEKITKDSNPSYGSIQKLHARDSDLVAICEDRVLKVLANKDALFNADGNQNLVSTDRVLGNIRPFIGDYGISLNPESFAFDSHRAYWADSSRGAVLRLSQDGITAISEIGMKDWFADHLADTGDHNIIGSFDDNKGEYNLTLQSMFADVIGGKCVITTGNGVGTGSGSGGGYGGGPGTGGGYGGGPTMGSISDSVMLNQRFSAMPASNPCSISQIYLGQISYPYPPSDMSLHNNSNEFIDIIYNAAPQNQDDSRNYYIDVIGSSVIDQGIGVEWQLIMSIQDNALGTPTSLGWNYLNSWLTGLYPSTTGLGPYNQIWAPSGGGPNNPYGNGQTNFWNPTCLQDQQWASVSFYKRSMIIDFFNFQYNKGWAYDVTMIEIQSELDNNPHFRCAYFVARQFADTFLCPETYDCVNGSCIDPGTGLGQYSSLYSCMDNCGPTWDCVSGVCIDPGNGNGQYFLLADCQATCGTATPSWDCASGGCYDPGTGNGQYFTLAACQAECGSIAVTYNCVNGSCIDPGTGNGQYSSLSSCQANCESVVVPPGPTGGEVGYTGGGVKGTLSFSEKSKGWVSFKIWNHENGISLNNSYYTFNHGQMYQHHINDTYNNFYGTQFESSVDILLNQAPGSIKSYSTFNYEGSQARITPGINNNPDYYDNLPKDGWYIDSAYSNAQELGVLEFWDKEDKWFAQVKGVKTEWLNDGTAGNIDPREFSFQGIGNANVDCRDCPDVVTWNCRVTEAGCECVHIVGKDGEFISLEECESSKTCCNKATESYTCCDGVCIDPGDGSGQYSNYCDCVLGSFCCDEGVAYMYTCGDSQPPSGSYVFGCMDDGITTDPFIIQQRPAGWVGPATTYNSNANVHSCDCTYAIAESWSCEKDGSCIEKFDGSGLYPDQATCLKKCGPIVSPCEGQNIAFDEHIINPTASALSVSENPCSERSTIDGSVKIKITDQGSSTPITTWTMQIYNSDWSSGSPQLGNLLFDDPMVYTPNNWSNVYTGLIIPPGQSNMNVYYIKITDNNGCEYGPFIISVYCNIPIDPCDGYVAPLPGSQYEGCCEVCEGAPSAWGNCTLWCQQWKDCCETPIINLDPCEGYVVPNPTSEYSLCCNKCNTTMSTSDPCYNWCQQWGTCCDSDTGTGINPSTGTTNPTLPSNYPCPPTDLTSPWYTYNPVSWIYANDDFPTQEFCDSDWCVDIFGNVGNYTGPAVGGGPHPDCMCCPTFDCVNGSCIENTTGTGTYANKILCLLSSACS